MIDFGGNYLPGFIGGPRDIASGTERMRDLCSAGIDTLLLTPRYYPAKLTPDEFVSRRNRAIAEIKPGKTRFPRIIAGCEVYIDERLKYISDIGKLALEGTRTIIADMPEGIWESALLDTVWGIQSADYDVIFAHMDSYPAAYAEDLFRLGYKGLLDISAFYGIQNLGRRRKLLDWIDNGYIIGLGSCFDNDEKKAHEKVLGIPKILGPERMEKLSFAGKRILK